VLACSWCKYIATGLQRCSANFPSQRRRYIPIYQCVALLFDRRIC
jgi:hypothetical protein